MKVTDEVLKWLKDHHSLRAESYFLELTMSWYYNDFIRDEIPGLVNQVAVELGHPNMTEMVATLGIDTTLTQCFEHSLEKMTKNPLAMLGHQLLILITGPSRLNLFNQKQRYDSEAASVAFSIYFLLTNPELF
jgi:hypothetical protein